MLPRSRLRKYSASNHASLRSWRRACRAADTRRVWRRARRAGVRLTVGRVVVVDGGQTTCRVVIFEAGRQVACASAEAVRHHQSLSPVEQLLRGPEQGLAELAGELTSVDAICLGLAAFHAGVPIARLVQERVTARTGVSRVLLTNDVVTSHAGALGLRPGVVVAAGTGAIALAVAGNGRWARSDGHGYLLGDAGSGFGIGLAGLRSAFRHADGRGGSAKLRHRAEGRFGSLAALKDLLYGLPSPVALVASFAEDVAAEALADDEAAAAIWTEAGGQLTESVLCAAGRVFPRSEEVEVSWTGGLFAAADLLLAPFQEQVRFRWPAARLSPPGGGAVEGGRLLAEAGPGVLFAGLVHVSG